MLEPKVVQALVQKNAEYLRHNHELIDIFEGNLLGYVEKELFQQLSKQSFDQAMFRVCPINVLPKIIDKLTNIYQTGVIREVENGNSSSEELLSWYEKKLCINEQMNCANELFNLAKTTLIYPYINSKGEPKVRQILNDRFVVYSEDPIEPNRPTHVVILQDKKGPHDLYYVYSDSEFIVYKSDGTIDYEEMEKIGLEDGINPYGKLPFVYVNESKYCLMPKQDTDLLKLTKLIPVMLTDLNFAAMFQCFSMLYGIDINDENIKRSPNVFLNFKSDPTSDKEPKIGMLKPEVDYDQVLKLIESQLSMWLQTRGIRASSVGSLDKDNFASGISKVIDEMDTYEARQKQISYFYNAEKEFWDLLLNYMHPYWVSQGKIENRQLWLPTAEVETRFAVQLPMQTRGQVVQDLKAEFESGFISRKRAIARLNPELSAEMLEELIEEIDEERSMSDVAETNEQQEETQETEEVNGLAEDQNSNT